MAGIGEIDVMEHVGEPDWVSAAVHGPGYSGEAGLVNQFHFADGDHAADWHVYAVDWAEDEIVFGVDGRVNFRVNRPMVDFRGAWVFDHEMYLVLNVAVGGTYPFKINGTRSPYYGVAEETVDAIRRTGELLVDWVKARVTGRPAIGDRTRHVNERGRARRISHWSRSASAPACPGRRFRGC